MGINNNAPVVFTKEELSIIKESVKTVKVTTDLKGMLVIAPIMGSIIKKIEEHESTTRNPEPAKDPD